MPPDVTPSVPTVPGLDLAGAMVRMDLSLAEMKELLAIFPDAVREEVGKLRIALDGGDLMPVRFTAHTLAGLAGNYGAQGLWAASKELELAAREGRSADVAGIASKLFALADEAVASAEQVLSG